MKIIASPLREADEEPSYREGAHGNGIEYRRPTTQLPRDATDGGCRKARWARGNRGKSGGIRAIFYYYVKGEAVYMIDAWPKNEKENLTDAEKNDLKKLSKAIEREGD